MRNGNSTEDDIHTVGKSFMTALADQLGMQDPMPANFAPPTDSGRMQRTAALTGQAIRAACEQTAKSVLELATEAEATCAVIRKDAEEFAASVRDIGNAHAERIEQAMMQMQTTLATIKAEHAALVGKNGSNPN